MKRIENYHNNWKEALLNIFFVERFKALFEKYNETDYDKLESRTDKKRILSILKENGYDAKYYAGGDFEIKESYNLFTFQLLNIVKNGMITTYLNVFCGEVRINNDFHFAFIYRRLIGNMDAKTSTPKFSDYTEFEEILKELILIYEDFKKEFLRQVTENDLA